MQKRRLTHCNSFHYLYPRTISIPYGSKVLIKSHLTCTICRYFSFSVYKVHVYIQIEMLEISQTCGQACRNGRGRGAYAPPPIFRPCDMPEQEDSNSNATSPRLLTSSPGVKQGIWKPCLKLLFLCLRRQVVKITSSSSQILSNTN